MKFEVILSRLRMPIIVLSVCSGYAAQSQVQSPFDMFSVVSDGMRVGQQLIDDGPSVIGNLFEAGQAGEEFGSREECLGQLQLVAVLAGGISNIMPFSRVWTYETTNGPTTLVDLLINGERIAGEAYCDDRTIRVLEFDRAPVVSTPEPYDPPTLDVLLGALILTQLQGAFDEDVEPAFHDNEPTGSPPIASDAFSGALDKALKAAEGDASQVLTAEEEKRLGPPLTAEEISGLSDLIYSCWNIGSLSSAAQRVNVTVGVTMEKSGRPVPNSIRLVSSEGGEGDAVVQTFESARRAILRCGISGFDLPPEKYERWRDIEMTFHPEAMKIE